MPKQTRKTSNKNQKKTIQTPVSTDKLKQIWIFDSVDRDGHFYFSPGRKDMNCEDIMDKMIHYSMRTWGDIAQENHDDGKKKHHYLSYDSLSKEAIGRIKKLKLENSADDIYSMRLNNMTRVIGLRNGQYFIVKWYDPEHEFCPSSQ